MEINAVVTLHFEDFASTNYLFLKDVCFVDDKINLLSTLDQCKVHIFKYFVNLVLQYTKMGKKCLFCTLLHLFIKTFKNKNFTLIQST